MKVKEDKERKIRELNAKEDARKEANKNKNKAKKVLKKRIKDLYLEKVNLV